MWIPTPRLKPTHSALDEPVSLSWGRQLWRWLTYPFRPRLSQ
jgi:hypothetical protein